MTSLDTLKVNLDAKRLLELLDPVTWLRTHTGFNAWPHEVELLRDWGIRTRVVRKSRQVGITTTIAHEAVWKAFTKPRTRILIVSPSLRQSKMVMEITQQICSSNQRFSPNVVRKNSVELQTRTGSSIVATPNNPDRIRGYTADDIYLDEAAHFLNDEPVMQAIKPMLSATQGHFTVISTPFGKRGLFWDQYKMAIDRKKQDGNVKAYEFHPSTISPLITPAYLEEERRNLTELEYKQEYEAVFIEEADVYLTTEMIEGCVSSDAQLIEEGDPSKYYVMGVDFAKKQDETVLIILEVMDDRRLIVRHIATWSHMDYTEQIACIGEISQKFRIVGGEADQTGVGEAVMEDLKKVVRCVTGVTFNQNTKFELASTLRTMMEQRTLLIPNHKRLKLQLNSMGYQVSKPGHILFQPATNQHDDYFWALALAAHSSRELSPYALGHKPQTRSFRSNRYTHG